MTDSPPLQRTSPIYVGMPSFPVAARVALDNTQQRRNLAHATSTIRAKRAAVVAEVADWEDVRLAGASAKDDALGDLAVYLEELETRLTEQGATVHWARDAAEANRIVVDLVRSNENGELGFLNDIRRMNVALTRARRFLLVIGDSATLGGHPYYRGFLESAEATGAWLSAWSDDGEPGPELAPRALF